MVALPKLQDANDAPEPLHPRVEQEYGFSNFVYFDLETIPDQSEGALAKCREKVKPPANRGQSWDVGYLDLGSGQQGPAN